MMSIKTITIALLVTGAMTALGGCSKEDVDKVKSAADDAASAVSETAQEAAAGASEMADQAVDATTEVMADAGEAAGELADDAVEMAEDASEAAGEMVRQPPVTWSMTLPAMLNPQLKAPKKKWARWARADLSGSPVGSCSFPESA
jgi:hypothetical protein